MSLLADKSPLSKLHRKRLFDHGGCQDRGFMPNFKRPKVNAIRQFPKHCGALAPRMAARPREGVSGGAATGNLKVEKEGDTLPVKLSENSVPKEMKSVAAELPTMSLVTDKSPLSILHRNRLFDHGGCQNRNFLSNFKCPKVDVIRHFPKHCGALAPRVAARPSEGVSGGAATGNLKVEEEGATVPAKPSGNSVPSDIKSEFTKPMVSNINVEALGQGMTADNGEKVLLKPLDLEPKVTNVPEHLTEAKTVDTFDYLKSLSHPHPLVRKYPPPKIRNGVTVNRKFPACFGTVNPTSESKVLTNKSSVEHRLLVETTRTDRKQIRLQIQDGHDFERKLEGNVLKEMVDELQPKSMHIIVSETGKYIEGRTSSEPEVEQDKERVETRLSPDSAVSTKINESISLNVLMNIEPEKYCEDKGAGDGSGTLMLSRGEPYLDMNPPCIDRLIPKREGKWLSNCEPAAASRRFKSQNHEVNHSDKSNSVLLKKQDITEASRHNYTMEKSVILSAEAAIRCEDSLFDDKERHKHILLASNDLGIVPHDNIHAVVSRNKVREALNLFEDMYTKLLKEREAQSKGKGKARRQIHLDAAKLLKNQHKWVNTEKLLGPVPGVEVGDWFRFRVELAVIGLHHEFEGGIDFKKKDGKFFATSLVASGRYANDAESSDVLIYSGQGGNPTIAHKKPQDQKLERGNLALKNSMDAGRPVRVIRGRQTMKASNILGKTSKNILKYIYDGLYIVTSYWQERGQYGKLVFKFELHRLAAQPKLTCGRVGTPKECNVCKVPRVADDISQGKEKTPIRAVNTVDDKKPPQFNYVTIMIYPEWYNPSNPIGCNCINGCSDSEKCPCTIKNGGKIPFNKNGAIIKQKHLVYECGPSCKCPSSCNNRVSQQGIRYQFEIFKTESRGWGVRSRNFISSGGFICEYAGELLRDKEAEQSARNDEYLFDIGNVNDNSFPRDEALDDDCFAIDAAYCGNVGRFINHSCSPNLYAQNVLYDHDDKRMPHIMLFATKNIPPLRELTFDYHYKVDQVHDGNGNVKKKICYCGSRKCSGRMY